MAGWYVYIVRTRLDTLYTGIAIDVARRLEQHSGTGGQGSKYLRAKGPLEVVYKMKIGDRELASRVEHRIKRLTRREKDSIVAGRPTRSKLLGILDIQQTERNPLK